MIPGYDDSNLSSLLSEFVFRINFADMSDSERELLFSEPLKRDPISRKIQKFLENFFKDWDDFLADQAIVAMQRVTEMYKLTLGSQIYRELLEKGNLPTSLIANSDFKNHTEALRKCQKHGKKPIY